MRGLTRGNLALLAALSLTVAGTLVGLGLAYAGWRPSPEAGSKRSESAAWGCEMGCEPAKTYHAPGTCPVCAMALSRVSARPYTVKVSAGGPMSAGSPIELRIQIADPDGQPAILESGGGHPVFVLITSTDLTWVSGFTPTLDDSGRATISVTLPHPGRYEVYADFRPHGFARQVPGAGFTVGVGPAKESPAQGVLEEDFDTVMQREGYEFRVRCNGAPFTSGSPSYIRIGVDRDHESVGGFSPILGQPGSVVILRDNPRRVIMNHAMSIAPFVADSPASQESAEVHTHHNHSGSLPVTLSNSRPTDIVVQAIFPEPGIYRVIAAFDHQGRLLTVPFTIEAQPAHSPAADPPASGSAGGL